MRIIASFGVLFMAAIVALIIAMALWIRAVVEKRAGRESRPYFIRGFITLIASAGALALSIACLWFIPLSDDIREGARVQAIKEIRERIYRDDHQAARPTPIRAPRRLRH